MTEAELLADRATGIGGSDVSSVLNVGYGCALRLYRQKRAEVPDFPRGNTKAMKLGKLLEPWIAEEFAEQTGCLVEEVEVKRSEKYPFLLVHADRLYWNVIGARGGVLEIKAVGARVFYQAKREGLPVDYLLQLNWGMGLWGKHLGAFALGCRDSGEVLDWEHARDDALLEMARDKAIALWEDIQAGRPPERLEPSDPRCQSCEYRKSCQGDALIHIDPKAKAEQDESMRPLYAEYQERKAEYEVAEEALEAVKEQIKDKMGDRAAVMVDKHPIYYRPQTRATWAADEMADDWCRLRGKVDYDGTFLPAAPVNAVERFKREGMPFRALRIY